LAWGAAMSDQIKSINQRIIDDLRRSRAEKPARWPGPPALTRRDAEEEGEGQAFSTDGEAGPEDRDDGRAE
jgi:hypothetical protein